MVDRPELVLLKTLLRPKHLLAVLALACLTACTSLAFHPTREHVLTPNRVGLAYRDVTFQAADGVTLHGWFLPASAPRIGSVLFLHGNAQNISTHLASVAWMPAAGFDVLLFDYRGYGQSEGAPDLAGLHLDVEAALDLLIDAPELDTEHVVVFGQSLGGALAVTALAESPNRNRVEALVIEGAFTGYRDMAREKLADLWLTWPLQYPLALTIDGGYRPIESIGALSPMPVLLIHGEADKVVPVRHGHDLFEAARQPKSLWLMPKTGHIQALADPRTRTRLVEYLATILQEPQVQASGS